MFRIQLIFLSTLRETESCSRIFISVYLQIEFGCKHFEHETTKLQSCNFDVFSRFKQWKKLKVSPIKQLKTGQRL
mgnify:CR=1 FL=1